MESLGIIPARGGSKAIPRKNLIDLGGKPLIDWTIEAAQGSSLSRLVVTTEDIEIASHAKARGVEVITRPPEYASDDVHAIVPTLDALHQLYLAEEYVPDVVMMLLPTSPFRTADHISDALSLWREKPCTCVLGVYRMPNQYLETSRYIDQDGYLQMLSNPITWQQRNNLRPLYRNNGAIFLCSERELVRQKSFSQPFTLPFIMSEMDSLEIDTVEDLEHARGAVEVNNKRGAK